MKIKILLLSMLAVIASAFVFTACGDDDPSDPTVSLTSIALNKSAATLTAGETDTLRATFTPANATDKSVEWTTSNAAVATVNAHGIVTAVAEGTANITVVSKANANIKAVCTVTVEAAEVELTSIKLDKETLTLNPTETQTLSVTLAPENATNKNVEWTTSNAAVATVDANGLVTAVAEGIAEIIVSSEAYTGVADTCIVTVNAPKPSSPVTITYEKDGKTINVNQGDEVVFDAEEVDYGGGFIMADASPYDPTITNVSGKSGKLEVTINTSISDYSFFSFCFGGGCVPLTSSSIKKDITVEDQQKEGIQLHATFTPGEYKTVSATATVKFNDEVVSSFKLKYVYSKK